MPELQTTATISPEGSLQWESPARLLAFLLPAKGSRVEVTLVRGSKRRTALQNSRLWSALYPFLGEVMEQRTGMSWSKDMVHDLCCRVFIGTVTVEVGGEVHTFRKRSSKLDTKQFSEFSDKVERWIGEEWKIDTALIQSPDEIA